MTEKFKSQLRKEKKDRQSNREETIERKEEKNV